MNYNESRDFIEILSLDPNIPEDWEIIDREYNAVDIDKVVINGNTFTNYGVYSFIWEKTYLEEPQRASDGSMPNLPSHITFLTAHLIMDFSIMSIDDYRKIMKLHHGANEFIVECYDPIYNRKIKVKMYFTTEQMAKLHTIARKRLKADGSWEDFIELAGVRSYSVEMIGTNNDLDLVTVRYNYNAPLDESGNPIYPNGAPVTPEAEESVYIGEEIIIGTNSTFQDRPPSPNFVFSHWEDSRGFVYDNGVIITVNSDIDLFAVWSETAMHNLSFNYGLSKPMTTTDPSLGVVEVLNRKVQYGESIGALPTLSTPYVEIDGVKKYPYHSGAWYKTPIVDYRYKVSDNEAYWMTRDTIIYAIWQKQSYGVTYVTNSYWDIQTQYVEYGSNITYPILSMDGFVFLGWYTDAEMTKQAPPTMPPNDLTLYAKWEVMAK